MWYNSCIALLDKVLNPCCFVKSLSCRFIAVQLRGGESTWDRSAFVVICDQFLRLTSYHRRKYLEIGIGPPPHNTDI